MDFYGALAALRSPPQILPRISAAFSFTSGMGIMEHVAKKARMLATQLPQIPARWIRGAREPARPGPGASAPAARALNPACEPHDTAAATAPARNSDASGWQRGASARPPAFRKRRSRAAHVTRCRCSTR